MAIRHQRGCNPKPTRAATAGNDWSDSSVCEYMSPLITVEGQSSKREIALWKQTLHRVLKEKASLSWLFENDMLTTAICRSYKCQSVSLNLLLISNHEDEDNLPEALAAISSQSTGKSGSTSSLDKQIQPSIYPQVTGSLTCAHTHCVKSHKECLPIALHSTYVGLM